MPKLGECTVLRDPNGPGRHPQSFGSLFGAQPDDDPEPQDLLLRLGQRAQQFVDR